MGSTTFLSQSQAPVSNIKYSGAWLNKPQGSDLAPYTDRVFITDVGMGGSEWYFDGYRWRVEGGIVILRSLSSADISAIAALGSATGTQAAFKLLSYQIPAGLISASSIGDLLTIEAGIAKSTASGDTFTGKMTIDTLDVAAATVPNTQQTITINTASSSLSASMTVRITSNTTYRYIQNSGVGANQSASDTTLTSSATFSAGGIYVGVGGSYATGGVLTTNLRNFVITLRTCGQ